MKKLIVGLGMVLVLMLTKTSAQLQKVGTGTLILPAVQLVEGRNAVALPGGCTLHFEFKGNSFSNFSFLDSLGRAHALSSSKGTVNGAPRVVCPAGQKQDIFASAEKNFGVSICKPLASDEAKVEYPMTVDMRDTRVRRPPWNRRVEVKLSK